MQATVLQSLGVRDKARISEPSFGLVSLLPADCEPGSGPAVYTAGKYMHIICMHMHMHTDADVCERCVALA